MNLSGGPFDFIGVFFGGVLVSFTPCIYPLLPITVAYIGANSADSRIKGFCLSLVYVTGFSITYAALGLIAVLTGSIFGEFSTLPAVRIIAGLVVVIFGIALWSGRMFRLPALKLPLFKNSGTYLSCLILGLTSGLIVSPCVFPVLSSILIFVAGKKNFIYGAFLLFSFAYGMGLLLILAGTFSSILTALPKSGRWMEVVKKFCAVILIIVGIYVAFSAVAGLAYAQDARSAGEAIDFSLDDIDGNRITLSQFKDRKSVILFFWTTWCPFCRRQMNNLSQNYSDFDSQDIEVLAINVQESKSKLKRFLSGNTIAYRVLLDSDARVAYSYGLIGVPTFILINKSGEVVFKDHYFPRDTYKRLLLE